MQSVLVERDLHPHRLRTFNFSPDPQFEEKLLEIVGLYMNSPGNALVLCMDEKTGIQALDRTQPVLPLRSGKQRLWSNEYVRHGDTNDARRSQVAREFPRERRCVVMDNPNTHKGRMAQEWLADHPNVTFHYTPIHASWVNLAECFFSILTRKGLQQSVHGSNRELVRFVEDSVKNYNKTCGPFVWTKGPGKLKKMVELTQTDQAQMHTHQWDGALAVLEAFTSMTRIDLDPSIPPPRGAG